MTGTFEKWVVWVGAERRCIAAPSPEVEEDIVTMDLMQRAFLVLGASTVLAGSGLIPEAPDRNDLNPVRG